MMLSNCFANGLPTQADKAVGREKPEFTEVSSTECRRGDFHQRGQCSKPSSWKQSTCKPRKLRSEATLTDTSRPRCESPSRIARSQSLGHKELEREQAFQRRPCGFSEDFGLFSVGGGLRGPGSLCWTSAALRGKFCPGCSDC
jgi:hypothetical protein